ncbi:MAG: PAS domain S-box protein [Anaerolineae bacterium]
MRNQYMEIQPVENPSDDTLANRPPIWKRVVEPASEIANGEQRRQSRLLTVLLSIFIPAGFLVILLPSLVIRPNPFMDSIDLGVMVIAGLLMLLCYALARSGRYQEAVVLTAAVFSLAALIIALPEPDTGSDIGALYATIFTLLFVNLFLSLRATLIVAGLNALGILALPLLSPQLEWSSIIAGPLAFLVLSTILVLVTAQQRTQTERDRQAQLAENENRYRLLAENATDMITTTTAEGAFLYVSPASYALLGYNPQEVVGRNINEFLHDEDKESLKDLYKVIIDQGENNTSSYRLRHRDGHYIWLEATSRVVNGGGIAERIISVSRDTTARKNAEIALRDSEAKYRMLIEQAADGIFITDSDGNLIDVNPKGCRMLDYTREELLGMKFLDLMVSGSPQGITRASKASTLDERRLKRKDGAALPVEMSAKQLQDGRVQAIVRDITERKQAESQRLELAVERERVEVLRRFISDASHDLRTPLSVMRTSLYLLKRTLPEVQFEKGQSHVQLLDEQIKRIETLLNDLLTMSNLDRADADTFEFRPCDVNILLKQIIADYEDTIDEKKHTVELIEGDIPRIQADTQKLRRAFEAILDNAINYTPDGGHIQLTTLKSEVEVVVEVKDNGIGINAFDLPHIFDRFYRVDKARRLEKGGMGLGLAIARRVVQVHSGKITVESTLGEGSTFRILLPQKILVHR